MSLVQSDFNFSRNRSGIMAVKTVPEEAKVQYRKKIVYCKRICEYNGKFRYSDSSACCRNTTQNYLRYAVSGVKHYILHLVK